MVTTIVWDICQKRSRRTRKPESALASSYIRVCCPIHAFRRLPCRAVFSPVRCLAVEVLLPMAMGLPMAAGLPMAVLLFLALLLLVPASSPAVKPKGEGGEGSPAQWPRVAGCREGWAWD